MAPCSDRARSASPATQIVAANLSPEELIGKAILDYRCGVGDVALELVKHHIKEGDAVDIGAQNIAIAQQRNGFHSLRFFMADLNHFELPAAKYDLIWSDTVLLRYQIAKALFGGSAIDRENVRNKCAYSFLPFVRLEWWRRTGDFRPSPGVPLPCVAKCG